MLKKSQNTQRAVEIIKLLETATKDMLDPASPLIVKKYGKDPFLILIGCLLSLRTRDTTSFPASCRLFDHARTPEALLELPLDLIKKLIYPVGFYHKKAALLHQVSRYLIDNYHSKVPATQEELLTIPGVGAKTANLVLGQAFDILAICVDVHVHRVSNRLGLVQTKTVEETEEELKKVIPEKYWIAFNHLIVKWGQNICVPISPKCSVCVLNPLCPKIGVTRHR